MRTWSTPILALLLASCVVAPGAGPRSAGPAAGGGGGPWRGELGSDAALIGELPAIGAVLQPTDPFFARIAPPYRVGMRWTYLFNPVHPDEPARKREMGYAVGKVADGRFWWGPGDGLGAPPKPLGTPIFHGPGDVYEFRGTEDVTVPAGTFQGALKFKVGWGGGPPHALTPGYAVNATAEAGEHRWFVPGLGPVKVARYYEEDGQVVESNHVLVAFWDGVSALVPTPGPTTTPPAGEPIAFAPPDPAPAAPCDAAGNAVTTIAGRVGRFGFADGPGAEACFKMPRDLAFDRRTGVVYVADEGNFRVRAILPTGEVRTVAGDGVEAKSSAAAVDGPALEARFTCPRGIAIDAAGDLYVADTFAHRIRRIDETGRVTTFAGDGQRGAIDGPGATARFDGPEDVAADPQGNLYVAEGTGRVRRIAPDGVVTTIAVGDPNAGPGVFGSPMGLDVDAAGTAYVATGNEVWRVRAGHAPELVRDGFTAVASVALDGAGGLYVTEASLPHVKRIHLASGEMTVVAGPVDDDAEVWEGWSDGAAADARFSAPTGMAIGACGELYLGEAGNFVVRKLTFR